MKENGTSFHYDLNFASDLKWLKERYSFFLMQIDAELPRR